MSYIQLRRLRAPKPVSLKTVSEKTIEQDDEFYTATSKHDDFSGEDFMTCNNGGEEETRVDLSRTYYTNSKKRKLDELPFFG